MTHLRQRISEDMQVRNLALNTQLSYLQQVSLFGRYFGKSLDLLGREDIRTYQVYLTNEQLEAQGIGVAPPTDAPLAGERLIEKHFDEGSNRRHDCLPSVRNPSPAAATSRMRSAVASSYQ